MITTSTTLLKAIGADADSPRWTEFVARYQPVMESFLDRNFPSVSAEDVMQETMIVLARKLPEYHYAPDTKGHFRNYLLGILKNKAREEMKRQGRVSHADDAAKDAAAISQPPTRRMSTAAKTAIGGSPRTKLLSSSFSPIPSAAKGRARFSSAPRSGAKTPPPSPRFSERRATMSIR